MDFTIYLKNNLIQDTGNDCYKLGYTSLTSATNVADDASSPNNTYDNYDASSDFTNEGSDQFTLGQTSTTLDDGEDLSTDGDGQLSFDDDICGDTRSTWYIGADEYVAAAPPARRVIIVQ